MICKYLELLCNQKILSDQKQLIQSTLNDWICRIRKHMIEKSVQMFRNSYKPFLSHNQNKV